MYCAFEDLWKSEEVFSMKGEGFYSECNSQLCKGNVFVLKCEFQIAKRKFLNVNFRL